MIEHFINQAAMGHGESVGFGENNELSSEDFQKYMKETQFNERDIVHLAAKYKDLVGSSDLGSIGNIKKSAFFLQR
jgi:hypothetical protein